MTRWTLILSLGLLALSPAAAQAGDSDRVSFGADIVIPEGETVHGDVVVVGADATVLGHVEGDLVVLAGNLVLGANSQVDGDAMHAGGDLLKSDAAAIAGSSVGMVQSSLNPSQLTGQLDAASAAAGSGGSRQLFETPDVCLVSSPLKARRDPVELRNEARNSAGAEFRASFRPSTRRSYPAPVLSS